MKKVDKTIYILMTILLVIYGVNLLITGRGLPCYIQQITHFYCPGCGITRMFISIFNLEFYQAFRYNPLVFTLIILTMLFYIIKFIFKKKYNKIIKLNNTIYIMILIITIVFGIMRNIPYFSFLAPTVVN